MATSLYFNGQLTAEPGAFTEVNAAELVAPAFGATGIVALLGTAIGGIPYNEIVDPANELQSGKTTRQVRDLFREGDLLELGLLMFQPGKDPDIKSGAQKVIFVKVNPAAPSEFTFENTDGDALTLTSKDFGQFTAQTKVTIADGSSGAPAKKVTIVLEDDTEIFDDLGVDGKATITYAGGSDGATTATVAVTAIAVDVAFTRVDAGMDTGFTQPGSPPATLEVVSASAGDTTQTITVYGLNASNVPQSQTATLSGTGTVTIPGTWNLVTAATLSAVTAGDVTLRTDVPVTVVVFTAGQTSKGRQALDIPATGALTVVASGSSTKKLVLRGTTSAGASLAEVLTLNGTSPVSVSGAFAHLTAVELANVEAARDVTIAGNMIHATFTNYPTMKRLEDHIESTSSDFTFVSLITNPTKYNPDRLDKLSATTILSATVTLRAVLDDIVTSINAKSQLVEAEADDDATGAPDNIGPVFLAGGHEGDEDNPGIPTAENADWLAAIDLLKRVGVNTIVPATDDDAIHAAVDAHCAYMCGAGRYERDAVVAAAAGESLTQLKARALALNSRHTRLVGQEVLVFNSEGESTWQAPMYQAALVAAAQAGSSVGTPLTGKFMNVSGVRQASDWNPTDDANEAILAGLHFMRFVDGKGIKIVRNISTYLVDENVVFSEASANQAMNKITYEVRTRMDAKVGKKGFPGTVRAAKAMLIAVLDEMKNEKDPFLLDYKDPVVTLTKDKMPISFGAAPVLPINFIPISTDVYAPTITA